MEIEQQSQGPTILCLYTLSIYHEDLLVYINFYGWPNNFLNGQILAEVFGHMS